MKPWKWPRLYRAGLLYPQLVLMFFLVFVFFSVKEAGKLKLETDLFTLLPKSTPSVANLDRFKKYFGSNDFFIVTVEGDDPRPVKEFADLFAAEIEAMPEVLFVDFHRPVEFFKKRQWLYLELPDLKEMEARIDRTLALEKKGVSLLFSDYMDFADEDSKPDLSFSDILEKYKKKPWVSNTNTFSISDSEGKFLAIRIKLKDEINKTGPAGLFIAKLKAREAVLRIGHGKLHVGYTGNLQNGIEENANLKREIALVSIIVGLALGFILLAYFRNFQSVFLVGFPLVVGIICTGGIITPILGHVNILTSFASAIIAGLGSDYGIYLLSRFYSERLSGQDFETSTRLAFANTGTATYLSMLTTVGAFLALTLSKFKLFYEFGMVGAIGISVNYLCMMLLIPSLLSLIGKRNKGKIWRPAESNKTLFASSKAKNQIKKIFIGSPVTGIALAVLICAVSAAVLPVEGKIRYQENLVSTSKLESRKLYKKVLHAVNESLSPTVFLATNEADEDDALFKLNTLLLSEKPNSLIYNNVVGLQSFVPSRPVEKKEILARIADKIPKIRWLPKTQKKEMLESLKQSLAAGPVARRNLPNEVKRFFVSPFDASWSSVYFYPSFGRISLETIRRYHEGVMELAEKLKLSLIPVDSHFIWDDLFRMIERESPRMLLLIIFSLIAVLYFMSRSLWRTWTVLANLLGSLIVLMGVLWVFGIQLNIMNIVAIPIVLGTGIDSFIHFAQRYDESGNMDLTLREKLFPIAVSNLTSIVGFAGLLLTNSDGLRSVGWVAVIGLTLVTLFCVFIFPRSLIVESHLRNL